MATITVSPGDDVPAKFASASNGDTIELRASTPGGTSTITTTDEDVDVFADNVTITERSGDTVTLEITSSGTSEVRFEVRNSATGVTLQAATPCTPSAAGGLRLSGNRLRMVINGDDFTMRGIDFTNSSTNIGITVGWTGYNPNPTDNFEADNCRIHDVGRYTPGASPSHCFYFEYASNPHVHDSFLWNADDRAIQLFPHCSNGVFERNVMYNCNQAQHHGNGKQDLPSCSQPDDNTWRENIVYNCIGCSEFWGYESCTSTPPDPGNHGHCYDMLFYRDDAGTEFQLDSTTGWSFSYDGSGLNNTNSPVAGTDYYEADPQFTDEANGDFTLAGSNAYGYGPASIQPGATPITPDHISSTATLYSPLVENVGVQILAPDHIDAAVMLFKPVVQGEGFGRTGTSSLVGEVAGGRTAGSVGSTL